MPASNASQSSQSIHVSFRRTPNGIEFNINAPTLEAFFRNLAMTGENRTRTDPAFTGVRMYRLRDNEIDALCLPGCFYEINNGGRLIDGSGGVNLAPLTVEGVENGITFTVRTVMNKSQMKVLSDGLAVAIRNLYLEMMAPAEHEINLSIEEISR